MLFAYKKFLIDRGYSKATIASYLYVAKEHLNINNQIITPSSTELSNTFMVWYKKNSRSTINFKRSAIKRFYYFLATYFIFDYWNVTNSIPLIAHYRLPIIANQSDINRFKLIIQNTNHLTQQERFIVKLVINHGVKGQIICNIQKNNIDFNKKLLLINYDISQVAIDLNDEDIQTMKTILQSNNNGEYLFYKRQRQLQPKDITEMFNRINKIYHLNLKPFTVRNTFILNFLNTGTDISHVKQYVGLKTYTSLLKFKTLTKAFQSHATTIINKIRQNKERVGQDGVKKRGRIYQFNLLPEQPREKTGH